MTPTYFKTIADILIALPILSLVAWAIFDIYGMIMYGESFIRFTISYRIREINSFSSGSIGALACLVLGILICHLFIR